MMLSKQKLLLIGLVGLLVVGLVVSAVSVVAQDDADPTPYPQGMMGFGMHGSGMSGMMGNHDSMVTAIADALGIDTETLTSELQDGKTLTQIAEELDVDIQTVYDAALGTMEEHMNEMVEAGRITQTQADTWLTWMQENIADMPMFNSAGFDHGMGMMGQGGMGMMGHGMGGHHGHHGQGYSGGWMMG